MFDAVIFKLKKKKEKEKPKADENRTKTGWKLDGNQTNIDIFTNKLPRPF